MYRESVTKRLSPVFLLIWNNGRQKPIMDIILSRGDESELEGLSQDLIFDLLSNPRRRFILYYLRIASDSVKLPDLAKEIASWEYDTPIEELKDKEQKRAYVSLYQTHVPKLVEAGLVDYDTDDKTLRSTPKTYAIDNYLPRNNHPDIRFDLIYIVLSIVGLIILIMGFSEASVFGAVSVDVAGVIILGLFSTMAVIHFFVIRRREQQLPSELSDIDTK